MLSESEVRRLLESATAIRIFCEAAGREAATVELARRVIRFLDRSQHDPELKFEDELPVI